MSQHDRPAPFPPDRLFSSSSCSSSGSSIMKVFLLLVCVAAAAGSVVREDHIHDHPYDCNGAGIFSDPADHCQGFHVCSFNWETNVMEHKMYVECDAGKLFNGSACVPDSEYTCPH
ncbi:uncharacterized protein LOC123520037 [Portunus trituberculatus]|uniref:uncharacterized protein LOC123520037 n=1 Tax=Portunus trituberculatus TaxID=210409 RepID=UPI001E1CD9A2|nr:uncharacterized protein LOC123520037 [Portunus trituberculatus]